MTAPSITLEMPDPKTEQEWKYYIGHKVQVQRRKGSRTLIPDCLLQFIHNGVATIKPPGHKHSEQVPIEDLRVWLKGEHMFQEQKARNDKKLAERFPHRPLAPIAPLRRDPPAPLKMPAQATTAAPAKRKQYGREPLRTYTIDRQTGLVMLKRHRGVQTRWGIISKSDDVMVAANRIAAQNLAWRARKERDYPAGFDYLTEAEYQTRLAGRAPPPAATAVPAASPAAPAPASPPPAAVTDRGPLDLARDRWAAAERNQAEAYALWLDCRAAAKKARVELRIAECACGRP